MIGSKQGSSPDLAIFLHDLRGGGAERAMLRLAGGIQALGRSVELWLVQDQGEHLDKVPEGVPVHVLGASSVASSIPALAQWLGVRRPRSLLSALTHVNVAAVLAARVSRFQGRVVVSERNQISAMAKAARRPRDRLSYAAAVAAYRGADTIVAVSEGVAEDVMRFTGIGSDRVRVIYNPVVDARTGAGERPDPGHPWLGDGGAPVVLAVGRLKHQKGFDDLLHAIAAVRARRPVRLIVLGEGPERGALVTLAAELGLSEHVSLPGFCIDPSAAMAAADLFVLSSRWEGFPNALVEAMAAGAPVVATDCPSGPREILDGGAFGRLIPVGDRAGLADAIADALDEPSCAERVKARASCFTVEASARQYLQALGV